MRRLATLPLAILCAASTVLAADSKADKRDVGVKAALTLRQEVFEIGVPVRGELTIQNRGGDWAPIGDGATLAADLRLARKGGETFKPVKTELYGATRGKEVGPLGFVGFGFNLIDLFPQLAQEGTYTLSLERPGLAASTTLRMIRPFDAKARYRLTLGTAGGDIAIDLFAQDAPVAVHNIVSLARTGFFDGANVTRIEPGVGMSLRGPETQAHIITPQEKNGRELLAGTVIVEPTPPGMQPANMPTLIVLFKPQPAWQGKVTVVGQVVGSEDALNSLAQTPTTGAKGAPPFKPVTAVTVTSGTVTQSAPATAEKK